MRKVYGLMILSIACCCVNRNYANVTKIAVIGRPNAGKSSFINKIVGNHVVAVSNIPHTTRISTASTLNVNENYLIFYDTPGLMHRSRKKSVYDVSSKYNLVKDTVSKCDLIAVTLNLLMALKYPCISPQLQCLCQEFSNIPSVLIATHADKINPLKIPQIIKKLESKPIESNLLYKTPVNSGGWDKFDAIFIYDCFSSQFSKAEEFTNYALKYCKPALVDPVELEADLSTILLELAREALLMYNPNEIPFKILPYVQIIENYDSGMLVKLKFSCPTIRTKRAIESTLEEMLKYVETIIRENIKRIPIIVEGFCVLEK